MFLRASQSLFILSFICFIGISIARPKEDNDSEKPSETDKDPSKGGEPEETIEEATEKALVEELKKIEDKAVSEITPVISEIMEVDKDYLEKISEEAFSTEKTEETKEESATEAEEEEPKNETPEDKPESTSPAATGNTDTIIEKEEAPKDTFALWDDNKKICLLAKFHAVFSIIYSSQRGEEKAEVTIPHTANSKGKCGSNVKSPVLQLSWGKNVFKLRFDKTEEENWTVTSMELTYDTAEPLFDGAVNDLCCLLNFSFDNT